MKLVLVTQSRLKLSQKEALISVFTFFFVEFPLNQDIHWNKTGPMVKGRRSVPKGAAFNYLHNVSTPMLMFNEKVSSGNYYSPHWTIILALY